MEKENSTRAVWLVFSLCGAGGGGTGGSVEHIKVILPNTGDCSFAQLAAPCFQLASPGQTAFCHFPDTASAVSYHRWKPGCDVPAMR